MSRKIRFIVLAALVAAGASYSFVLAHRSGLRATGPVRNDAYVWQRAWTEAVKDAVVDHGTNLTELIALNAEVNWKSGRPQVVRVPLDAPTLGKAGARIGLALRIGPYRGPFKADDAAARFLSDLAGSLLADAATNRLSISELQIDFDCAESKLDGYAVWVDAIRRKATPVPVTITALPVWLKHAAAFKRLIAATDGYVLQVHSLERPKGINSAFTLCDPTEALHAVEIAGRLGRPFRVALPTYGYLVAFDREGRFTGLSAEGPQPAWPDGVRLRQVGAEPAAMARLVQSWTNSRPPALMGVIWYRLPIGQEQLNWCWPTLSAVMSGAVPQSEVRAELRRPDPALVEIDLFNAGTADFSQPAQIKLHWSQGRLLAADGLKGFETADAGLNAVQFQSREAIQRLEPGERRTVGWARLDKDAEVQIEFSSLK